VGTYTADDLVEMAGRGLARVYQRVETLHGELRASEAEQGAGGRDQPEGGEGQTLMHSGGHCVAALAAVVMAEEWQRGKGQSFRSYLVVPFLKGGETGGVMEGNRL